MIVRRATAWLATVVVAIGVAVALPVSQLRTIAFVHSCCCPDPDNCHCPPEKPEHSGQPALRACHNTSHAIVAPTTPAFSAPAVAIADAPLIIVRPLAHALPAPHDEPPPARPDAPS